MKPEKNDEELVLLYQAGDTEALKNIIDKYTPLVYNFVARIAKRENAADLTQETFIKVWKNIYNFDLKKASFKTWLFTIAKNTTTDFLRKKKFLNFSDLNNNLDEDNQEIYFEENIADTKMLPLESLVKLEDMDFLNKIIDALPEKYRTVLLLHYQEEMTFDEIGKILNKPLNTVKSQHRRGVEIIRKKITHQNDSLGV